MKSQRGTCGTPRVGQIVSREKPKHPTSIRLYFISTFLQLHATQRLDLYHLNLKITAALTIKLLTLNSPNLTRHNLLIPTTYTYYMIACQQISAFEMWRYRGLMRISCKHCVQNEFGKCQKPGKIQGRSTTERRRSELLTTNSLAHSLYKICREIIRCARNCLM